MEQDFAQHFTTYLKNVCVLINPKSCCIILLNLHLNGASIYARFGYKCIKQYIIGSLAVSFCTDISLFQLRTCFFLCFVIIILRATFIHTLFNKVTLYVPKLKPL